MGNHSKTEYVTASNGIGENKLERVLLVKEHALNDLTGDVLFKLLHIVMRATNRNSDRIHNPYGG